MKNLHQDESGIIREWIVGLFGVFLLILTYALFVPIGNILINVFVENGAPYAQMMFIRKMVMWTFGILGVLCLMYPFIAAYRKTYDQGVYQYGGFR